MGLKQMLEREKLTESFSHAYLFLSSDSAEIEEAIGYIIKQTGCLPHDVIILEATEGKGKASEIKVEDVRDFLHGLNLTPFGPTKIGIIRECEKLNSSSANILLKTLEEPPKNVILILQAKSSNIIATIKSRCRVYKTNGKARPESMTFSYENILTDNLALSFKNIEKLVKDNDISPFLSELESYYELKMLESLDKKYSVLLEEIVLARKKIKGNANPRLTLENLVLKIRNL